MTLKILALAFALCLCDAALHAQSLSEQNLIDLKKAGVDKAILIQQIEKDGISFQMDAPTTIRLKNLGFPDEVLSTLISAGGKKFPPDDPVKALYSQGKYAELCDYLKSQLEKDPANYRLRTILIGSLLKINRQAAALAQLEKLGTQTQDPVSKPYIERASLLVSSWQKQQESKNKLLAALQNYSYTDADSAIDQFPASAMQKQILHTLIDAYAGKFDAAGQNVKPLSFVDQQRSDDFLQKIAESQIAYKTLMEKADFYIHSPLVPSNCTVDMSRTPDLRQISLQQYGDVVTGLTKVAPLSSDVMDLAFHLALLSAKYEDLEVLGDKILAAKGTLRIPFYSSDRFFAVVIDAKKRRIYTLPDSHPFLARYAFGFFAVFKHDVNHSSFIADLVPFDLGFEQISGVAQRAGDYRGSSEMIAAQAYALKFEPSGTAPNYALMQFLFCTEGEEAEMQATKNLGQFVLHVIGNPNIKTELANPKKAGRGGGFADALVALYGATNGNTALGAAAMQMMAEDKAKGEIAAQQQATWQAMLARDYSSLLDGSVFDGLDKLVETP